MARPDRRTAAQGALSARDTMRRVVLRKGERRARLEDAPRARHEEGAALVRSILVGLDGTDAEALAEPEDRFAEDSDALVLGHECLGEVIEAPEDGGVQVGDRVVPLVRHGCGMCVPCDTGTPDLCTTGRYHEHGLKGLDGFLREEWADDPATLVVVPGGLGDLAVLTEPTSVIVKALKVAQSIQGGRLPRFDGWHGKDVLLAGTGSLGTLAAFLLLQEGARVWAFDRTPDEAYGSRLLDRIGVEHVDATQRDVAALSAEVGGFDLVIEATGSPRVALDSACHLKPNGISVLLGVPGEAEPEPVAADALVRNLVLGNRVMVGSVNSNRHHFEEALSRLQQLHDTWGEELENVITHRFSLEEAADVVEFDDDDAIKHVVEF